MPGGGRGARAREVLRSIAGTLTPAVVPMGTARGLGTRAAAFTPYPDGAAAFRRHLLDLLADHDDALLAAYVADEGAVHPAGCAGRWWSRPAV